MAVQAVQFCLRKVPEVAKHANSVEVAGTLHVLQAVLEWWIGVLGDKVCPVKC